MKELEEKVQKLIELSNQNDWTRFNKTIKMEALILEIRKLARAEQTVLGRIIRFPHDDKYSHYLITEIHETFVIIECLDLYDGLVDKGHGKKSCIDKMQAECYIRGVEAILKLFPEEDLLTKTKIKS